MGIDTITAIIRSILIVILYFIFGFGSGVIVGVWLANRFGGGKDQPLRMDAHREQIKKAGAHNSQWNPEHERWQK